MDRPLSIGLDPILDEWIYEIKYTLRTLMRVAGLSYNFQWAQPGQTMDISYGQRKEINATVRIPASNRPFAAIGYLEPEESCEIEGIPFLYFGEAKGAFRVGGETIEFPQDIVFASYWFLSGAHEAFRPHDRWGNQDLSTTSLIQQDLLRKPIVSIYGAFLRRHFARKGRAEPPSPLSKSVVLSHDVDYPQMIRWIECLRLFQQRGVRAWGSMKGVLNGTNHFWGFPDWITFEDSIGAKSASTSWSDGVHSSNMHGETPMRFTMCAHQNSESCLHC